MKRPHATQVERDVPPGEADAFVVACRELLRPKPRRRLLEHYRKLQLKHERTRT